MLSRFFRRCILSFYIFIIMLFERVRFSTPIFSSYISTYSRFVVEIRKQYYNTHVLLRNYSRKEFRFFSFLFSVNHDRSRRCPFIRRLTDKRQRLRGIYTPPLLLYYYHPRVCRPRP